MDPRYPIGAFHPLEYSIAQRDAALLDIQLLPQALEYAILNLDAEQLYTPYREGGWTVHQLIHHVADSHLNAYIRFKLALTETLPVIKPYEEKKWAELPDVKVLPVNISLTLLHALHARWHALLRHMDEADFHRCLLHPEHPEPQSLWFLTSYYAWHGRHHTAHIQALRENRGW